MKRSKTRKLKAVKPGYKAAANYDFGTATLEVGYDGMQNTSLFYSNIITTGKPASSQSVGWGTTSISLHGKTEANWDYGTGTVTKQSAQHAKDCNGCEDKDCITWSGTFKLTFKTNPTITLPGPSEYAHLSPCQRKRVKAWISDVLQPHELQHKAAFKKYDGVVRKPFNFKICQDEMSSELLKPIHNSVEEARRNAAQAASDALDPFHSNIDLDCEDKKESNDIQSNIPTNNS